MPCPRQADREALLGAFDEYLEAAGHHRDLWVESATVPRSRAATAVSGHGGAAPPLRVHSFLRDLTALVTTIFDLERAVRTPGRRPPWRSERLRTHVVGPRVSELAGGVPARRTHNR